MWDKVVLSEPGYGESLADEKARAAPELQD